MARARASLHSILTAARAPMAGLMLVQCSPVDEERSTASAETSAEDKLDIMLMTSLPIIWGDGASMESIISGETAAAPIYTHWQSRYELTAVDSLESLSAAAPDLVILAQPPAMDPADIAALDDWLQKGGQALIFTDPLLSWPSNLPLGDRRRPLATGLLSPLLRHWGLELVAPEADESGTVELEFADARFTTVGLGKFASLADAEKEAAKNPTTHCRLDAREIIAQCQVGKGQAILVADADMLNDQWWDKETDVAPAGAVIWVDRLISDLRENRG